MKTKNYIASAALAFATLTSCGGQQEAKLSTGIDLTNLDTTAVAGQDFFQFACGGFNQKHPLTAEYSRFGAFEMLIEENQKQIKGLIESLAANQNNQSETGKKVGTLYNLAMDSVKLNKDGIAPVKPLLDKIAALSNKDQIIPMKVELSNIGIGTYFGSYVYADAKNSDMNIFQMGQGGINLGEKEYYLDNDAATTAVREAYKKYITRLFVLAGNSETEAAKKMKDVMEVETAIAKASLSAVELRNPEANYNKMSFEELEKTIKGIDWKLYVKELGLTDVKEVNVGQIKPIQAVAEIIKKMPLSKHVSYLQYNVIDAAGSYLSDDFVAAKFDFYGKVLSGRQANQPRWKRAVGTVNGVLGELVGQMYVEKYFPAAAKERMVALVKNLQTALGERIQAQEWMSEATKVKALDKLANFHVKVGYPDSWKDYSSLNIENDSYWANICRAAKWATNDMLSRHGKPVDKDEWLMSPQTVNAYYNPTTNEICFPAAILQYPFFDMNADDAFNYGAIGVVIGHEMTHGFDDQGRRYNKEGNMQDWWAPEDAKGFTERTQVMVDFFDKIEVLPGLMANGQLTLGENIADHGGLNVSFTAYKNATKNAPLASAEGFTADQRFFLAYSALWAGNIRDEEIRSRTKSDPHSLGRYRVNGALPHIAAWYEAWNITPESPMYVAPEDRVNIW